MKYKLITLVILSLSMSISWAQDDIKGFLLLQMGKSQHAKNVFNTQLSINKNDAQAWYGLGEAYFVTNQMDSASKCFREGISVNPQYAYNFIGLGKHTLSTGNLTEAQKQFDQARKIGKKDVKILATIAEAFVEGPNNYIDFASNELKSAQKIDPLCSNIFWVEGIISLKNKDYSAAATNFEQTILYDSLNAGAYLNYAAIYANTTNKQPAIDALNHMIRSIPEGYVAYRALGDIYYDMANYTDAKKAYEIYLSYNDYTTDEKERYAFILFFLKDYDNSLVEIRQLSNNDPENYIFLRLMSYMDYETKAYDKGYESFEKFFSKIPENKIISMDFDYYGKTLSALNYDSLATIAYEKAYEKDTTKMALLDEVAKMYLKQKKYNEAITYYTKILNKKQSPLPLDYFQLGRSYYLLANSIATLPDSVVKDTATLSFAAHKADSLFDNVCILSPSSYLGFIWRARTNSLLDPESTLGLSKPYYEQTITFLLQNPAKYIKEIIETYSYLGYYYYITENKSESIKYWNKIIELDPTNEKALAAIKDLTAKPK